MAIPTLEVRERSRRSIASLTEWVTLAETSLQRGIVLPKQHNQFLVDITGATELPNQLEAVTELRDLAEEEYLALLRSAASSDLSCFVEFMTPDEPPAPHHDFLCGKLMAFFNRQIMRMTVSMPPGHAKTKFCSRYGPAFYLGNNPNHRWLHAGHSQDFVENEFGKYVRDIIADPKYQEVFPTVRLNPASRSAGSWRLAQQRGGYVCKGVGQKISGYRGHIGGGDDLLGSREDAQSALIRKKTNDWLFTDFRTRFLPNSPIFLVATRWHHEDVIGFVEQMNKEGRGIPWDIINLNGVIETEEEMRVDPMGRSMNETLWSDYYDYEHMMELKATLLPSDWWALYKGKPTDQEGGVVKGAWFATYKELPKPENIRRVVVSIDCAEKTTARSKYTAITVWFEDVTRHHYLVHVTRKKLEFTDLIKHIADAVTLGEELAQKRCAAILIEDAGHGTQYIQQMGSTGPAPIITIPKPGSSKEFRMDGVAPMFQAGEVLVPENAPWLVDYKQEILIFPSTYTDQADATSQYLEWARKKRKFGTKKMRGTGQARPSHR